MLAIREEGVRDGLDGLDNGQGNGVVVSPFDVGFTARSTNKGQPLFPVDPKEPLVKRPASTIKRFSTRVSVTGTMEKLRKAKLQEKKRQKDLEKKKTIRAVKLFDYIEVCKKREIAEKRARSLQKVLEQRKIMAAKEKRIKLRREENERAAEAEKKAKLQEKRLANLMIAKVIPSKQERLPTLKNAVKLIAAKEQPAKVKECLNSKRKALFEKYAPIKPSIDLPAIKEAAEKAKNRSTKTKENDNDLVRILTEYTKPTVLAEIKINDTKPDKGNWRNEKMKAKETMFAVISNNKIKTKELILLHGFPAEEEIAPNVDYLGSAVKPDENQELMEHQDLAPTEHRDSISPSQLNNIVTPDRIKSNSDIPQMPIYSSLASTSLENRRSSAGYRRDLLNPISGHIHFKPDVKKELSLAEWHRRVLSTPDKLPPNQNSSPSRTSISVEDLDAKTIFLNHGKSLSTEQRMNHKPRPYYHERKIEINPMHVVTQAAVLEPTKTDFFLKPTPSGKAKFWIAPTLKVE